MVAIGASAGGLDVFKLILSELDGDTGFATVFVQHLDASHDSVLTEILSQSTAMPVQEAADGMKVAANHVYVMPSGVDLTLQDGALRLVPRTQSPGSHMPIDRFMRSIAEECGSRAIGIILSGTGADGSAGVEAIKAAGGVTFAQDANTAKFPAMPRAAVATGCVDFILPPEAIVAELKRMSVHPYLGNPDQGEPVLSDNDDTKQFSRILSSLHVSTGIDFSLYREHMIKRRILRRLALGNIETLAEYNTVLQESPEELAALHHDLLIGVTSFFRDPAAFEALKTTAFPRLLQTKRVDEPIRIWVAGCATGEEAYSIAIVLQEFLSESRAAVPYQIFASDLNRLAIEKARSGKYPDNIIADLTPERLNRYFTKVDGGYQVVKSLRDKCVFARHNLIADPPFSRLDLITCRNVLIYMGNVQKEILPLLHYALNPGGFLMLGASESGSASHLFSVADRDYKIFAKRETARRPGLLSTAFRSPKHPSPASRGPATRSWEGLDRKEEVDRIVLSKYSWAAVVVNEDLEVLEIRGKANAYLSLPEGRISFNLINLIPDTGLFLEVEKIIQQARKTGEPAHQENVPYEHPRDGVSALNLEARPLETGLKPTILVLFEPVQLAAPPLGIAPQPAERRNRQIERLKQQLAESRQRLLDAAEEHNSAREESQNDTEEALSANEELQSLNEELETTKEELQSTNEELVTVNDELHAKNSALSQARDFAMSIVETVRQPLLVLEADLRVRLANRAFYRTFQLTPREAEGRSIFVLSRDAWDFPALRAPLELLARTGQGFPVLEVEEDFPNVGLKSLVLSGCHLEPWKIILLFIDDVTEQKRSRRVLLSTEEHLRQAQKMEAVGRLAGGIAHDFNNLLTAIIGYSSLLYGTLKGNDQACQFVQEIKRAGERAAGLTQQLLAFSRRQVLQPKVIELNAIVLDSGKMLRHLVGEGITMNAQLHPKVARVKADPGEIGRAIVNLVLNARDAMSGSGSLTIETANVTIEQDKGDEYGLPPGEYAMLAVTDTGVGIDPQAQAHIFEPFFTTKGTGKGTGLGLATVQGIIEQSGGGIICESEVGQGSTFRIFLPAVEEAPQKLISRGGTWATVAGGNEVILLVEDEELVRSLSHQVLKEKGYTILEASNGREGLEVCRSYDGTIHLLLSDVVMPEMGGRELAESAAKLQPAMKVLFMSGHTPDEMLKEEIEEGIPFLQKPFSPTALAQKVRDTLNQERARSAGG